MRGLFVFGAYMSGWLDGHNCMCVVTSRSEALPFLTSELNAQRCSPRNTMSALAPVTPGKNSFFFSSFWPCLKSCLVCLGKSAPISYFRRCSERLDLVSPTSHVERNSPGRLSDPLHDRAINRGSRGCPTSPMSKHRRCHGSAAFFQRFT